MRQRNPRLYSGSQLVHELVVPGPLVSGDGLDVAGGRVVFLRQLGGLRGEV